MTYTDEEHPSRLDFGKHKFGGPFAEEEVEDVKTIFRLTPLLLFLYGVVFLCELNLSQIPVTNQVIDCLINFEDNAINDLSFVLIPVYRFIVYPLARKHIPSMFKMIGAGLILCLVSTVINTVVAATGYFLEQSQNITMPDTLQVSMYWIL